MNNTAYCTLEYIQDRLSKLPIKNYNKYQWWRRFEYRRELSDKAPTQKKIEHGDFEVSDYLYQAELEIYMLEKKEQKAKSVEEAHEMRKLSHERYRRLVDDFEKDEKKLLANLKKALINEFKIGREELDNIMESFDGTTLELYNHLIERRADRVNNALKK